MALSARMRCPSDGDASSSRQACRNSRSRPSGPASRRAGAVDRVARDRVADRVEMDPDLVGPAGDQVELEQRPAREPLADAVAGRGRAVRRGRPPSGPMLRVAADRRLDPPDRGRHVAGDQRQVRLAHAARLELGHQRLPVRASCLATISRPLVSRSRRWTIPGRATPGDAAVLRRRRSRARSALTSVSPSWWPGRRVDDEAGRLVDDQQVVVLVDDAERRCLARAPGRARSASGRRAGPRCPAATIAFARTGTPSAVSRPSEMSFWT